MQQKATAEDLERRLEELRMDLQVAKAQQRFSLTHLAGGIRSLSKAIKELSREGQRTLKRAATALALSPRDGRHAVGGQASV